MSSRLVVRLRSLFQLDGWLFLSMVPLILFGTAAIYSVDLSRGGNFSTFKKHLIIVALGLLVFFVVSAMDYTVFRATAVWWYVAAVVLLVLVLLFGETIRGTQGWFRMGPLSLQPAEFAKLALVFMLAYFFSRRYRYFRASATFVGSLLFTFILQFFILMQPDLGSALLLGLGWLGVMLFVGTKKRYWAVLLVICMVASAGAWSFLLQDYQKNRILAFFDCERDPLGAGYNIRQSIIAIGAGAWKGRGLGFGSQSQLKFLPEAQSDFVFAVIGEELGFVGALALVVSFGLLFLRILTLLPRAPDDFTGILLTGICVLLFAQFLVNVGGTLGMVPVTGVPLPLVSVGGSSFLITMIMLGVVQSIYRNAALAQRHL